MNKKINYGMIFSVVLAVILLAGAGFYVDTTSDLKNTIQDRDEVITDKDNALLVKDTEISNLVTSLGQAVVDSGLDTMAGSETIIDTLGYLIDDLYLNASVTFKNAYSNREVTKLFDGEVDFKDDSYDAEETLKLSDMKILANENDFEGTDYLTIKEGGIKYVLTFEDGLNTSEIDSEDTLKFNLLGVSYEVSEWKDAEVTFTKGDEYIFKPLDGVDSMTIDGKLVKVVSVSDDGVFVEVDGVGKSIDEDRTRTVNGLEIHVKDCFESSNYVVAVLKIGKDIKETILNGEEFEDDSIWNWEINEHSIGLVLNQDFTDRDEDGDEEYPALGKEENICLPNDYVCIKYNGLGEVDREDYSFDLYDNDKYVRVEGNFQSGTKDYDKIYVNSIGIYDKDKGKYILIDKSVDLGDTDYRLSVTDSIKIGEDFGIDFKLISLDNYGNHDYEYLTKEGILIGNTDDLEEDNELEISVPEEQVYGSLLVY